MITDLSAGDSALIEQIAQRYYSEWATPLEKTRLRLSSYPNDDVLAWFVATRDRQFAATGGLCYDVNLLQVHPRFSSHGPWIAMLYTEEEFRNQGYGSRLLDALENRARELGLNHIYLYTFTAESLYERKGWKTFDRVIYKGNITAIMKKEMHF